MQEPGIPGIPSVQSDSIHQMLQGGVPTNVLQEVTFFSKRTEI